MIISCNNLLRPISEYRNSIPQTFCRKTVSRRKELSRFLVEFDHSVPNSKDYLITSASNILADFSIPVDEPKQSALMNLCVDELIVQTMKVVDLVGASSFVIPWLRLSSTTAVCLG